MMSDVDKWRETFRAVDEFMTANPNRDRTPPLPTPNLQMLAILALCVPVYKARRICEHYGYTYDELAAWINEQGRT
jgi:hypothetical protein